MRPIQAYFPWVTRWGKGSNLWPKWDATKILPYAKTEPSSMATVCHCYTFRYHVSSSEDNTRISKLKNWVVISAFIGSLFFLLPRIEVFGRWWYAARGRLFRKNLRFSGQENRFTCGRLGLFFPFSLRCFNFGRASIFSGSSCINANPHPTTFRCKCSL